MMKVGDKEFSELQLQFEKEMLVEGYRLDREHRESVPHGWFYQDGLVNMLFKAYMKGYAFRDCIARLE